jgi:hypothetical protein
MRPKSRPLPADDEVVISVPTTRWVMDRILALAASGRYPRSFSACADEILRTALREIERSESARKRRA